MKYLIAGLAAFSSVLPGFAEETIQPHKLDSAEIAGAAFTGPGAADVDEGEGRKARDFTSYMSKDRKVNSGMYKAGPGRFDYRKGYGVDEFMYFLKGGIKLTSIDGKVTVIHAGEAVTIPRDWKGIWESDGYEKIYVVSSPDKPLE